MSCAGNRLAWLLSRLASRLTAGGELVVTSTLTRDQNRNRKDAIAKERRITAKKHRGNIKKDRRGDD